MTKNAFQSLPKEHPYQQKLLTPYFLSTTVLRHSMTTFGQQFTKESVMVRRFVIAWRPPGGKPLFFRGDNRYEIFLAYISDDVTSSRGWVKDVEHARVFDTFPDFNRRSFAKNFNAERLRIFPYDGELLPTQVTRPTRRPNRGSTTD